MQKALFPGLSKPKFKSSWKDLSQTVRTSSPLVYIQPVYHRRVYPDDYFKVRIKSFIESFPLTVAMSGSFEVNYDFYFEPDANLYGWIDNNVKIPTEYIQRRKFHTISYLGAYTFAPVTPVTNFVSLGDTSSGFFVDASIVDAFNSGRFGTTTAGRTVSRPRYSVGAGSLLEYVGYPVGYSPTFQYESNAQSNLTSFAAVEKLNANAFFSYFDIYRFWYANQQSRSFDFLLPTNNVDLENPNAGQPVVDESDRTLNASYRIPVSLQVLDALFMMLRNLPDGLDFGDFAGLYSFSSAYFPSNDVGQGLGGVSLSYYNQLSFPVYEWNQNEGSFGGFPFLGSSVTLQPYHVLQFLHSVMAYSSFPNGGLLPCTYKMDMYRGLMDSSTGEYRSIIDTSGDSIDVTSVWYANRMQMLIDQLDLSGGRFSDWVQRVWGSNPKGSTDAPLYLGSFRYDLNFHDVTATYQGEGESSPVLGQQASRAVSGGSSREIKFKADTYGTLMCMFYIRPKVSYSLGIWPEDKYMNFSDQYNPFLQDVGFVDVPNTEVLAVYPDNNPVGYNSNNYFNSNGEFDSVVIGSSDLGTAEVIGRRLIWTEADTAVDRTLGQYAYGQPLSAWAITRPYVTPTAWQSETGSDRERMSMLVQEYSQYMNPSYFNLPFAFQQLGAQNFRCVHRFDVSCYRKKGRRDAPHM